MAKSHSPASPGARVVLDVTGALHKLSLGWCEYRPVNAGHNVDLNHGDRPCAGTPSLTADTASWAKFADHVQCNSEMLYGLDPY